MDRAQLDCVRMRRLAANLYRAVRPTLARQPRRRENTYIALDALANTLQAQCMQDRKAGSKTEPEDRGRSAGVGKN